MSFEKYKNIHQPIDENTCGAYALAACLDTLGLEDPKKNVTLHKMNCQSPQNGYTDNATVTVSAGLSPSELIAAIYKVTGNLNLNFYAEEANYVYGENGFNSPSALVYVAKAMQVPSVELKYLKGVDKKLSFSLPNSNQVLFDVERTIIEQMQSNTVSICEEYVAPQSSDEAHIVLVNGGGHWVAVTKVDGVVQTYNDGNGVKDGLPGNFAGLWIVLKK